MILNSSEDRIFQNLQDASLRETLTCMIGAVTGEDVTSQDVHFSSLTEKTEEGVVSIGSFQWREIAMFQVLCSGTVLVSSMFKEVERRFAVLTKREVNTLSSYLIRHETISK